MPHCPLALISSSRSTTSAAPKCRAARGTWCLTARQPLFLRRGAPRPPLQNAGRPRGRGASLPASPCFFVEEHHVLRSKMPAGPRDVVLHCPLAPCSFVDEHHVRPLKVLTGLRDVVLHCPPALVSSSRSTTSSGANPRHRHPAVLYKRLDFSKSRFFSINVY